MVCRGFSLQTAVWLCFIEDCVSLLSILYSKIPNLKTKSSAPLSPQVYQHISAAALFQHVQLHNPHSQGKVSCSTSAPASTRQTKEQTSIWGCIQAAWFPGINWKGYKWGFLAHLRPEQPLTPVLSASPAAADKSELLQVGGIQGLWAASTFRLQHTYSSLFPKLLLQLFSIIVFRTTAI